MAARGDGHGSHTAVALFEPAREPAANGLSARPLLCRGMDGNRYAPGRSSVRAREAVARATGCPLRRLPIVRRGLPRELGHRKRDAPADARGVCTRWPVSERRVWRTGPHLFA